MEAAEDDETIVYTDLRSEKIDETRKNVPIHSQRRFDVYPDVSS